jgi:hypothetical protein
MQPIYKGGNKLKTDPASYRGIYLSSAQNSSRAYYYTD